MKFPVTINRAQLSPAQQEMLAAAEKVLAEAGDAAFAAPKSTAGQWLKGKGLLVGWKTYVTVLGALGYVSFCMLKKWPVDMSVLAMFGFTSVASLRSAFKTSVAQVVNAVINPSSPAAQTTAATVETPINNVVVSETK